MRGSIISLSELIFVIAGVAMGLLLLHIVDPFGSAKDTYTGSPGEVAGAIAKLSEKCWKSTATHRSESEICKTVHINSTGEINESIFTEKLDCKVLPNLCEGCPPCGSADKVNFDLECADCEVVISYDAPTRKIWVRGFKEES